MSFGGDSTVASMGSCGVDHIAARHLYYGLSV
jgi:hypothetical protein